MLQRPYIDNFRSLVNFECKFYSIQLLMGPNGSGKSTVFDGLSFLRDFSIFGVGQIEDYFGGRSRTLWQNVDVQTFEVDVAGNGGTYRLRLEVDGWGNPERPRIVSESVTFDGQTIFRFELGEVHLYNDRFEDKVQYPFDWHRSALATTAERRENTRLTWMKNWLAGLRVVRPDPRRMSGVATSESKFPAPDFSNFAEWYTHLRLERTEQEFIDLLEALQEVVEGLESIRLESLLETRRIRLRMRGLASHPRGDKSPEHMLQELSDGQRVLIALYTSVHFLLTPDRTLCFDEPDNFIALREIQPWLNSLLEKVDDSASGCQVLIISHHPELLNRLAVRDGLLLSRPNGLQTRIGAFEDSQSTGLSPAELVARGWENE